MRRTYRVAGAHRVLGREPGETFQADLPPEQEARMLARGSITRAGSGKRKPADEPAVVNGPDKEQ